jgi:hypothetical protein
LGPSKCIKPLTFVTNNKEIVKKPTVAVLLLLRMAEIKVSTENQGPFEKFVS